MTRNDQNRPEEEMRPEQQAEVAEKTAAEEKEQKPCPEAAAQEPDAAEKYAQLEDKYLRVLAEYDNYRKRSQKERDCIFSDAVATTVSCLLPVLDNLQRAEASARDEKGAQMIVKQFLEILEKMKVKPFGEAGEQFDPNLHHAILHVEDENFEENSICEVMLKGYMMGDRVIRAALVKVAN